MENEARRSNNNSNNNNSGGNVNNIGGSVNSTGSASTIGNVNTSEADELNSVTSHKLSDFLKANIESLDSLNKVGFDFYLLINFINYFFYYSR